MWSSGKYSIVTGSSNKNPLKFGKHWPSIEIKLYRYFPFIFIPRRFNPDEYNFTNGGDFKLYLFSVNILSPIERKVRELLTNLIPS